jgi:hypothetical protein
LVLAQDEISRIASRETKEIQNHESESALVMEFSAPSSTSYSWSDRLLHRIALGTRAALGMSFELECLVGEGALRRMPDTLSKQPVYITGLARSGTTILLRVLAAHHQFQSLTYGDMPFVMAPNLWRKVSRSIVREPFIGERAHGDGLQVGLESPEAFEEVFWRSFNPRIRNQNCFCVPPVTADAMHAFAIFRDHVVLSGHGLRAANPTRYLSKNNNNILRMSELLAEKDATMIVAFRNPLETAQSLFRQHLRFLEVCKHDRFILTYMNWLNHFEFGPGHLPFWFAAGEHALKFGSDQIDYWLQTWISYHEHLVQLIAQGQKPLLFEHQRLLDSPRGQVLALAKRLALDEFCVDVSDEIIETKKPRFGSDSFDSGLQTRALEIFDQLKQSRLNVKND